MKVVRKIVGVIAFVVAAAAAAAEETGSAVKMEPVRVGAIWSNAEVRVIYQRGNDEPRISLLRVESVREKSAAARAGLEKGMEIVAMQGVTLNGLTDDEFQHVMRTPVIDALVLRVRRGGRVRTEELRIPVAK